MLYRLRHDFQLSILTLLGAVALLGIFPFAVYRFANNNPMAGFIDLLIIFMVFGIVLFAWKTGDTRRAGLLATIVICAGAVAIITIIGSDTVYWLFPVLVSSFFLTTPVNAFAASLICIAVIGIPGNAFDSSEQMSSFIVTCFINSLCAYIFAHRSKRQHKLLQRLATHDPLTGAKNRRALEEDIQVVIADHKRTGAAYALFILDLDYFKRINDRFGHAVGDQVLVACAELLCRCTRVSDDLYRFGGEEFVMILPGVQLMSVSDVAENMRARLSAELNVFGTPVTASIGAASLREGDSMDSWMERADTALYSAKNGGRNRVVIADYLHHAQSETGTTGSPA